MAQDKDEDIFKSLSSSLEEEGFVDLRFLLSYSEKNGIGFGIPLNMDSDVIQKEEFSQLIRFLKFWTDKFYSKYSPKAIDQNNKNRAFERWQRETERQERISLEAQVIPDIPGFVFLLKSKNGYFRIVYRKLVRKHNKDLTFEEAENYFLEKFGKESFEEFQIIEKWNFVSNYTAT